MELEVREVEASQRPRLRTRVDSYQAELRRLKQAFQNACSTMYIDGMVQAYYLFVIPISITIYFA